MRSTPALTTLAIILSLVLGVIIGLIVGTVSVPVPPTVIRDDTRALIPVVKIDGVEDGLISGSAHGDVRLFLGEKMVLPDGSGSFRVPAGDLLKNVTTVRVPSGMRFVASKRGKKYYPVASATASRLAPANRVYFPDAISAQNAGFLPED
ncbi:MAG: hypothetical protein HOO67_04930 [Candidatus Peribacteraceae bacterium]|nr:hypothetical protein [Candidatus Peribacteraceae bacterium]